MIFSLRQKIVMQVRLFLIKLKGGDFSVGENVYIGRNSSISAIGKLSLGSNIYIGKNVTIEVGGTIGDGCLIANNVGIVGRKDHDIDFNGPIFFAPTVRNCAQLNQPVRIGSGVWLGYGAVILSGISIGNNVIVAAGSVVIKDVEDCAIVGGNPARVIGYRTMQPQ